MNGIPTLVNDVMTYRAVAVRTGAAFKDIVMVTREWRVSALPVLDDAGHVVGVVSEVDLLPNEEYRGGDVGRYGQRQDLRSLPPPASWRATGANGCRWSTATGR
ncbi:CBS domain-containing protein [Streptomyces sp. NPDC058293]|uniref:CBS domain-containing protein n=1 Tax=unclassified Streptomyces TaxID=2593676 RepID=UPI0033A5A4B8